jgi:hypothetical protein
VLSFPQVAAEELDGVLTALPPSFAIAQRRSARFVAGPSGAFVVLPASDDLDTDATRLLEMTTATRSSLADHLAWAPFVDSLLVTPDQIAQPAAATVAPIDMLSEVLREGHQAIDDETMDRIFVVLAEGGLAPGWRLLGMEAMVGPADGAGRMPEWNGSHDLTDPSSPSTTSGGADPRLSSLTRPGSTDGSSRPWSAA